MAPRLTVAFLLVAAASLAARQATFRVTTEVIGIDVYVTDDDGNPVVDPHAGRVRGLRAG